MNIVDFIDHHAARRALAPAIVTTQAVISYAELAERLRRLAAAVQVRGVTAGQRVGVRMPAGPPYLLAVLALARLGVAVVPMHHKQPAQAAGALARRLRIDTVLGLAEAHAVEGAGFLRIDDSFLAPVDAAVHAAPHADGGDRLLLITLSSGTTGEPKAIPTTHWLMRRGYELQQGLRPYGPGVRTLVMTGLDSSVGLRSSLRQLMSGATVVVMRDASLRSMAVAIDALGVNHVQTSPALIARIVDALDDGHQRFPDLPVLRLAGSLLTPALLARIRRRLCSHVHIDYGASEVGGIADASPELLARAPQAVGHLMPWIQAEAVDEQGRTLPHGTDGVLRMRSDCFPGGYLDDPQASAQAFREGWFYPGDIGHVTGDGLLVVRARADELINIGGSKIHPAEVEHVLLQDPTITDAAAYAVAGSSGLPVLLAAVVCTATLDEAYTLARCRAILGQKSPQRLVQVGSLPRNGAGKLMRRQLAERTRLREADGGQA